jgi:hypothetical protein
MRMTMTQKILAAHEGLESMKAGQLKVNRGGDKRWITK